MNILKIFIITLFFNSNVFTAEAPNFHTYNKSQTTKVETRGDIGFTPTGGEENLLIVAVMLVAGVVIGIPYLIYKLAKFIDHKARANKIIDSIIKKVKNGDLVEKIKEAIKNKYGDKKISANDIKLDDIKNIIKETLKTEIINSFKEQDINIKSSDENKMTLEIDKFLKKEFENINNPEELKYYLDSYKQDLDLTPTQENELIQDTQKLNIEPEKLSTLKEVLNKNTEIANSKSGNISIYTEAITTEVDGETKVTEGNTYIKVELDGKETSYYKQEKRSTSLNEVSEQLLSQDIKDNLDNSDTDFATISDGKITTYLGEQDVSFYTKDKNYNQEATRLGFPDTETIESDIQAESPTPSDTPGNTPPSNTIDHTGDYPGDEPGERSYFEPDSTYHIQYGDL